MSLDLSAKRVPEGPLCHPPLPRSPCCAPCRDVSKRPTAQEALQHEWLRGEGDTSNRHTPLHSDVVQRLQRYGQSSLFKRNVLQMIAQEILPLIKVSVQPFHPCGCREQPAGNSLRSASMAKLIVALTTLQSSQHGAAIFSGFSFSSASLASMVSDAGSSEGPMIPCSVCGRLCQGASTMAGLSQRGLTQYKRYAAGRLPHGAARAPGDTRHPKWADFSVGLPLLPAPLPFAEIQAVERRRILFPWSFSFWHLTPLVTTGQAAPLTARQRHRH